MAALRDYFGTSCPVCAHDILQKAPSVARMPPGDYAWCASCESHLTLADLAQISKKKGGFLARLFGKPSRA